MTSAVLGGCCAHGTPISVRVGGTRDPPMSPLTSVVWSGLSCFSLAICGPWADGSQKESITRMAWTTPKFTAPSSPWFCPEAALWKLRACRSCTSPGPRPPSMWAPLLNVLGRVPLMPLFLPETLLRPSHTSSISTGAARSHMGWQVQPTRRARREATSTR